MGVYINDMEIPKDEYGAMTVTIYPNGSVVEYIGDVGRDFGKAVQVPPHGRLIDADALMAEYERDEKAADEHGREFSFSFKSGGENCTEWWPVQQKLFYAPTIIPADPAEEGT